MLYVQSTRIQKIFLTSFQFIKNIIQVCLNLGLHMIFCSQTLGSSWVVGYSWSLGKPGLFRSSSQQDLFGLQANQAYLRHQANKARQGYQSCLTLRLVDLSRLGCQAQPGLARLDHRPDLAYLCRWIGRASLGCQTGRASLGGWVGRPHLCRHVGWACQGRRSDLTRLSRWGGPTRLGHRPSPTSLSGSSGQPSLLRSSGRSSPSGSLGQSGPSRSSGRLGPLRLLIQPYMFGSSGPLQPVQVIRLSFLTMRNFTILEFQFLSFLSEFQILVFQ